MKFSPTHSSGSPSKTKVVLWVFAIITALEAINILTGRFLNNYAIFPRSLNGLYGIPVSPFIHGSIAHYASNIVPLCIFSYLLLQYGFRQFINVTLFSIVFTGVMGWAIGRPSYHLGASGVLYGYFGFLVLAGFLSKRIKLILISLLIGFFYGGLIFGVLPIKAFVSWESHLFGLIGGLLAAKIWAKQHTS